VGEGDAPMAVRETLSLEIHERLTTVLRSGRIPQILLDLDGTLLDNTPRSKRALVDSARHLFGGSDPLVAKIRMIRENTLAYDPIDTLRSRGAGDEAQLAALREEWTRRFFSGAHLDLDVPQAGAVAATKRWWELGAELSYLTGRSAPEMGSGTFRSMQAAGFPVGVPRVQLLLKAADEIPDVTHKLDALPQILARGPIVLVVDNDSRMLNALVARVPDARAVLVKTSSPKNAPAPAPSVVVAADFRLLA